VDGLDVLGDGFLARDEPRDEVGRRPSFSSVSAAQSARVAAEDDGVT
jgi:hypothetical protein